MDGTIFTCAARMGSGNWGWVSHTKSGFSQDPTRQWKSTYAAFLVVCFYPFKETCLSNRIISPPRGSKNSFQKMSSKTISTKTIWTYLPPPEMFEAFPTQNTNSTTSNTSLYSVTPLGAAQQIPLAAAPSWSPGLRPAPMHLPWSHGVGCFRNPGKTHHPKDHWTLPMEGFERTCIMFGHQNSQFWGSNDP